MERFIDWEKVWDEFDFPICDGEVNEIYSKDFLVKLKIETLVTQQLVKLEENRKKKAFTEVKVGPYSYMLRYFHNDSFWLCTETGEGTEVKRDDLFALFDKFFQENM